MVIFLKLKELIKNIWWNVKIVTVKPCIFKKNLQRFKIESNMTSVCSGRCEVQRKRTEIVKYKNYKKLPGIKGQDHVTRPIRQGNNPNFYDFCFYVFYLVLFILLTLFFYYSLHLFPSPNRPKSSLVFLCLFLLLTYTLCCGSRRHLFLCTFMVALWVFWSCYTLCVSDTSTATAMIGFRERERTRERRLSWARLAIFFLWVILVFSLISLFFSMDKESKTTRTTSTTTTRTRTRTSHLLKRRSFTRTLFHTPSRSATTSTGTSSSSYTHQKPKVVELDPHHTTLYGDDKRIIHTGPNPLHN